MDFCDRDLAAAHALGALPAAQARAFGRHLIRCVDCRTEAGRLLEAASSLAAALPAVNPPPPLRRRIVGAVRGAGS